MGLQEKKKQHDMESSIIPEINKEINEITGGDVTIDIDWASFTDVKAMQEIEHQVLGRIREALQVLCEDDFAKGMVKDGFKTIKVINLDSADGKSCTFADNTLTIQTTWADFGSIFTPGDIREVIEGGL